MVVLGEGAYNNRVQVRVHKLEYLQSVKGSGVEPQSENTDVFHSAVLSAKNTVCKSVSINSNTCRGLGVIRGKTRPTFVPVGRPKLGGSRTDPPSPKDG